MHEPPNYTPPPRAAEDAATAFSAFERGDWRATLAALSDAFSNDPFPTEWLALLDRALDAGGAAADEALEDGGENWVGYQAMRAYAAHRRGDFAEAFDELADLIGKFAENFIPEAWGLGWITPETARVAGSEALEFLVVAFQGRYPEPYAGASDWSRAQMNRAVSALEIVEAAVGASERTLLIKGHMLSKAGRAAEAIALTESAATANPTFRTATAAAMAHKRAGDIDAAVRWFRQAAHLDPQGATSLLDIGDTMAEHGRWQEALGAYEEALVRQPGHHWAYPSAVFCRYRLTGDPALLEELRDMANLPPDDCGMSAMMKQMGVGYTVEDRRQRAVALMQVLEPDFAPAQWPHDHDHDEEEDAADDGDEDEEE